MENEESKVTYRDGDMIRALRGKVEVVGNFIKVERRNATVFLNQEVVLKIEKREKEGEEDER